MNCKAYRTFARWRREFSRGCEGFHHGDTEKVFFLLYIFPLRKRLRRTRDYVLVHFLFSLCLCVSVAR